MRRQPETVQSMPRSMMFLLPMVGTRTIGEIVWATAEEIPKAKFTLLNSLESEVLSKCNLSYAHFSAKKVIFPVFTL